MSRHRQNPVISTAGYRRSFVGEVEAWRDRIIRYCTSLLRRRRATVLWVQIPLSPQRVIVASEGESNATPLREMRSLVRAGHRGEKRSPGRYREPLEGIVQSSRAHAEVVEWHTRCVEVAVLARASGFKSRFRHKDAEPWRAGGGSLPQAPAGNAGVRRARWRRGGSSVPERAVVVREWSGRLEDYGTILERWQGAHTPSWVRIPLAPQS